MTGRARGDNRRNPSGSAAAGGPRQPPHHVVTRMRMGAAWFAAAWFAVVLVLLLIFILQNSREVQISYLGARGHLPLGVALLFAAVLGILLAGIPGTARIIRLRITARRHRAIDAGRGSSTQERPGRLYPRAASPPTGNGSPPAVTDSRLPSYMEIW
jgi:uncharacterized integral membrane protein